MPGCRERRLPRPMDGAYGAGPSREARVGVGGERRVKHWGGG